MVLLNKPFRAIKKSYREEWNVKSMSSLKHGLTLSVSTAVLIFAAPAIASGQAAPSPQAPAQAPAVATTGEIIVTAQKRAQNLQDVPLVVTVLNQRQLQDANVRDIKDLTVLTPGLTVTSTGSESSTTARIRGVGTVSDNIGLEDQVGVVIDGVARPRNGVAFNDLGELADIEVLKGPQGTLFGANTTAGVINITTARPSFKFGATGEATVSNYNGYGGSASVTGPLVDDVLAGRLYIAGRSRDGFYKVDNAQGGDLPRLNDEHFYTARGQLLWTPNANFDVNFIADYTKRNDHAGGAVPILDGLEAGVLNAIVPGSTAEPAAKTTYVAYDNRANIENITDQGLSAEAHWKTPWFGGATLTSITAVRDWKDQSGSADLDSTGVDLLAGAQGAFTEFKQYSEELRYQGHTDKLDWLVGGYFKREDLTTANRLDYGSQYDIYMETLVGALGGGDFNGTAGITNPAAAFPANRGTFDQYSQHENAEAIFTQETYKLTDKLELTGGFRYTWEAKTLDTLYTNDAGAASGCTSAKAALGPVGFALDPFSGFYCSIVNDAYNHLPDHQSLSESAATGTVKLAYRFNRDLMTYGSYSRGYLVGGFNLARTDTANASGVPNSNAFAVNLDTSFKPTFVDAYEFGAKSTLFDRRMTLNGALFYQDYSDFQLNAFNGIVFVVTSVPEVISRGAELESTFRATQDLTLNLGVTYSDTYYPDSAENKAALNAANGLERLPGHRLSLAPSWSIAGGVTYQHAIAENLMFNAGVDVKYISSANTGSDLDPAKLQPGYQLWNATVGIGPRGGRWNLSVWSQNLFNQRYEQVAFNGADQTLGIAGGNTYYGYLGLPRTFGATLRVKY
jgi:iron complex outermembrane receptor protein